MEDHAIARRGLSANPNMKLNPNLSYTLDMLCAVTIKDGYCPCSIVRNEDTYCPCKKMRENNVCNCGLFVEK